MKGEKSCRLELEEIFIQAGYKKKSKTVNKREGCDLEQLFNLKVLDLDNKNRLFI